AFYRRVTPATPDGPTPAAPLRYRVMSSVPDHWIPFLPAHVAGDNREVQLQRGALPRFPDDSGATETVPPRTTLLAAGLDETPHRPFFIHEEEVPRAGTQLTLRYQRARGRSGRVYTWLGVRRQTGRGEASSGLTFDLLTDSSK